jgi:hypothetical protein
LYIFLDVLVKYTYKTILTTLET